MMKNDLDDLDDLMYSAEYDEYILSTLWKTATVFAAMAICCWNYRNLVTCLMSFWKALGL